MTHPHRKRKTTKRKPQGYAKDVRTALILNMFGEAGLPNMAPNYLSQCAPAVRRAVVRQVKRGRR